MQTVPVHQAKDRFSSLLQAVEDGEEIVITRHGKAAVRVVPVETAIEARRKRSAEALERMRVVREQMRKAGLTATTEDWIAWRNEGRR